LLKGKRTERTEDGLGVAWPNRLAVRLRRDRPLQRQGMMVPGKAFAVTQRRKKVVTRKLYAFVLLLGRKLFCIIFLEYKGE